MYYSRCELQQVKQLAKTIHWGWNASAVVDSFSITINRLGEGGGGSGGEESCLIAIRYVGTIGCQVCLVCG